MTSAVDWFQRVQKVRSWTKGDRRAPHKPLLLLYALGRLQDAQSNQWLSYRAVEPELQSLLDEFGPPNPTKAIYPFHHLTSDGLWVVKSTDGDGSPGASAAEMRRLDASGELDPQFAEALLSSPELFVSIVHYLLDTNFPATLHPDICGQVGIDLALIGEELERRITSTNHRHRSPAFREEVLIAYEKSCAMCGFDAQLNAEAPGLEAAHVQWFKIDGPDEVSNGLCLCSLHHKLFDRGVMGLSQERTILVSARFFSKSAAAQQMVFSLAGKEIAQPQPGFESVHEERISWHTNEVFKLPARKDAEQH